MSIGANSLCILPDMQITSTQFVLQQTCIIYQITITGSLIYLLYKEQMIIFNDGN